MLYFVQQGVGDNGWALLILFLPFNLFSNLPDKNTDANNILNKLADIEKLKQALNRLTKPGQGLVEYTGPYAMYNRQRYLWYIYEYLLLARAEVYPSVFSEAADLDLFNVYAEVFTSGDWEAAQKIYG